MDRGQNVGSGAQQYIFVARLNLGFYYEQNQQTEIIIPVLIKCFVN